MKWIEWNGSNYNPSYVYIRAEVTTTSIFKSFSKFFLECQESRGGMRMPTTTALPTDFKFSIWAKLFFGARRVDVLSPILLLWRDGVVAAILIATLCQRLVYIRSWTFYRTLVLWIGPSEHKSNLGHRRTELDAWMHHGVASTIITAYYNVAGWWLDLIWQEWRAQACLNNGSRTSGRIFKSKQRSSFAGRGGERDISSHDHRTTRARANHL